MLHMFQTYVAIILYECCVCFTMALRCFFPSVLDACFKCFIYLETYVASVISEYFKSRSGVTSRFLLALVSPPSLNAAWASEQEA
jgi:hypothetical protein